MERYKAEKEVEKKAETNGFFKDVMAKMCIQIFKKNRQTKQKQKRINKGERKGSGKKERKEETGFSNDVMPQIGGGEKKVSAW